MDSSSEPEPDAEAGGNATAGGKAAKAKARGIQVSSQPESRARTGAIPVLSRIETKLIRSTSFSCIERALCAGSSRCAASPRTDRRARCVVHCSRERAQPGSGPAEFGSRPPAMLHLKADALCPFSSVAILSGWHMCVVYVEVQGWEPRVCV